MSRLESGLVILCFHAQLTSLRWLRWNHVGCIPSRYSLICSNWKRTKNLRSDRPHPLRITRNVWYSISDFFVSTGRITADYPPIRLLGQGLVLQASLSTVSPLQFAPPCSGGWQSRLRMRVPPAHVTGQTLHSPHSFHLPSTTMKISIETLHLEEQCNFIEDRCDCLDERCNFMNEWCNFMEERCICIGERCNFIEERCNYIEERWNCIEERTIS